MKENERQIRICPRCGNAYTGVPSLSRDDNKTYICSDCGTREALTRLGVSAEEQEEILKIIHRHYNSSRHD